jgi:hypothetical protein
MEEERGTPMHHVNVVIKDEDDDKGPQEDWGVRENICGGGPEDWEKRKGNNDNVRAGKRRDDFRDDVSEAYPLPEKETE